MSKVLISSLIDEINSLLSRPVGSMSKKPSSDIIPQRDQLKQLRSQLESLTDDSCLANLDNQYQTLVTRLQGQIYTSNQTHNITKKNEEVSTDYRTDKSKTDRLEILPYSAFSPVVDNLTSVESDMIKETSTMTNGAPESNSTFVNDRMIATLQQAIQQTLQQVVKESVQTSVQQVLSQTLAVERALIVGEISANLNKIVESQQRSQISQELVTLNQQKQKLNTEISQLESDRADWMKQFQEFQTSQQESLDRSLRSVNTYLQDQIRDQITDTVQQTMTATVAETVNQTVAQTIQDSFQDNLINFSSVTPNPDIDSPRQEEFVTKVQEQTDRFLVHLDEMFSSTFRSLEQDIQVYQTSIEAKLGHIETLEQKGEALISALVDRISQQTDNATTTPQSEVINAWPELPDDIPDRYLETVAEPADENLINALLAGNQFGEEIVAPTIELITEPVVEQPIEVSPLDIFSPPSETTNEEYLNLELEPELNLDDYHYTKDQINLVNKSATPIGLDVSEIENILGASSDTLFENSTEEIEFSESFSSSLSDLSEQDTGIIEDPQSALAARELNPDFDLEAATQIVENFNKRNSEIEESDESSLQSLDFSLEEVTESEQSINDPQLLRWLEDSNNRPTPTNIAEVSPDEELMSWLGNDAIDMAKLPYQDQPQAQIISSSISELVNIDFGSDASEITSTPSSEISLEAINDNQDSRIENQIEHLFNNFTSDQASDSEESLILLINKNVDNFEFPEWEDSLVNELNSDLESLNTVGGTNKLTAANLDQFIRNTPYALTNWETEESQAYPTIIEVSAKTENSDQLQPSVQPSIDELEEPLIVENSNVLFIDKSNDLLDSSQDNLQFNRSDEQSEIVINSENLQISPFTAKSDEIPEIFDNPESLFHPREEDKFQKIKSSTADDMDAIFADVIAKNAAKYLQSTPFETNDELDELFLGTSNISSLDFELDYLNDISTSSKIATASNELTVDNKSELDTLLFGFDPATEIEHDLNKFASNEFADLDITTNASELIVKNDVQISKGFDTVMQDWQRDDYDGLDDVADTMTQDSLPSLEPIEVLEELDTILQGFAQTKFITSESLSEVTEFVPIADFPTVLENPRVNIPQEDDWSNALEQLEARLTQPINDKKVEANELSADEFFASLEYEKLNDFADIIQTNLPSNSSLNLSNELVLDVDNNLEDDQEDSLLNEFADAQSDGLDQDWDNLLDDLNSFNFNQPLLADHREQLGLSSVAPITDTSENVLDIDSLVMESRSVALIPPPPEKEVYSLDDTWLLGVDFGSTAIRVSLLNSNTGRVYSLYLDDVGELPCKLVWSADSSLDDPITKDIRILTKKSLSSRLENGEVALSHLKQFLKIGLPYRGVSAWQPIIQWSDSHQASLRWLIAALKNLLEQIQTRANHPKLPDLGLILLKLSGVIFGYPSNWSDTYILNVREAILKAGLVNQAEQVMAVEQAIAPVLSLIHDQKIPQQITLLIDAGAVTTSLCLINDTSNTKAIARSNLHIRSFDYAGISISQDIIVQLFYPHWQLITNTNRHLCKFDHLNLPKIGDSAPQQRILLQQYLLSSDIGQQMIELADRVKVTFGKDMNVDSWNEELMGQPILVFRRELENLILQPFIQRLNRELNGIMSNAGLLSEDVRQVFLLGNTMQIPLLSRWLAQKLPHASIDPLATSIVANGLAVAPLYPNLQDVARQQYSDYFLLQEICRLNLTQSINSTQLLQQLQMRGINIKACRDRILTILQGDLPDGLFPWQEPEQVVVLDDPTLSSELFTGRLFELETDGTYQPNVTKFQQLRVYLQAILGNMSQTLKEPLVFPEIIAK